MCQNQNEKSESERFVPIETTKNMSRANTKETNIVKPVKIKNQVSFKILFTNLQNLQRFIILAIAWLTINLVFYCFGINVINIPGSTSINILFMTFFQILSYPLVYYTLQKFSRKANFLFWYLAMFVILLVLLFNSQSNDEANDDDKAKKQQLLSNLVGLPVTGLYQVIFLIGCELFDTEIRGRAISMASIGARLAGTICPIIISYCLQRNDFSFMYGLLLGFTSLQFITVWFLPDLDGHLLD